jgi:hypothetical protein
MNGLFRARAVHLQSEFNAAQEALEQKAKDLAACYARVSFGLNERLQSVWDLIVKAHSALQRSERIWDITSSVENDRVKTRSTAVRSLELIPVSLSVVPSEGDIIAFGYYAIRIGNANGNALDFYPGMCFVRNQLGDFALVDLSDMNVKFEPRPFIETGTVPADAKVIRYAWEKANKDGTRDRRFVDNRQVPVALYGELSITSSTGLNEAYLFSNPELAAGFAEAFIAFQQAQKNFGSAATDTELAAGLADDAPPGEDHGVTIPDPPRMVGYQVAVACASLLALVGAIAGGLSLVAPVDWWHRVSLPRQVLSILSPMIETGPAPTRIHPDQAGLGPFGNSPSPSLTVPAPITVTARPAILSPTEPPRATVLAKTAANIRRSAGESSPIVQTAHAGERFTVFARAKGWVQVGADRPVGWIAESLTVNEFDRATSTP